MLLTNYNVRMANQSRALGGQLNPTRNFDLARMNTFYVGDTSSLAPFVTNLVKNGGFEFAPPFAAATTTGSSWIDGTAAGSTGLTGYGWGFIKGGTASAMFDTSTKLSGTASLKCSTLATGSYAEVNVHRVNTASDRLRYVIPVLPSTPYTVTGWMRTNYVSGDSTYGASIGVLQVDASGTVIVYGGSTEVKTTTDWTKYTVSFTTNASTQFINIQPRVYGHVGTATLIMDAWFDDISITLTNQVTRSSTDNNNQYASQPQFGLRPPYSLVLPPKAGGMSMSNTRGTGALSAGGFAGLGGTVTMAGTGVLEATGGLLAGLEVTMAGSGDLTAIGGGLLEAIVSMAGSGTLAGALSATAGMTVEMAGVGTVSFAPSGTGEMEVIIYVNQSQATVDQIVTGVTDSLGSITATVPNLLNTETGDVIIPLD